LQLIKLFVLILPRVHCSIFSWKLRRIRPVRMLRNYSCSAAL
jgi:hypothetical protein